MCSVAVLASIASAAVGEEEATSGPACTSRPASEIVLVRIGDEAVLTQAEFDREIRHIRPEWRPNLMGHVVARLVEQKLLLLYVAEHPELVSEDALQAAYKQTMKEAKVDTLDALKASLQKKGTSWTEYRNRKIRMVAQNVLAGRGIEKGKDEALLKRMYDANPQHWNGASVTARHILLSVSLYATPAQREAKRRHLARIREDIVSGKRAWDECVQESDYNTKYAGGLIGDIPRYNRFNEALASAVWDLKVGELSDIIEDHLGFQIVEATGRKPGYRDFSDRKTQFDMKSWLEKKFYRDAIEEMWRKHAIVGVQAPTLKPVAGPSSSPASRPAARAR